MRSSVLIINSEYSTKKDYQNIVIMFREKYFQMDGVSYRSSQVTTLINTERLSLCTWEKKLEKVDEYMLNQEFTEKYGTVT